MFSIASCEYFFRFFAAFTEALTFDPPAINFSLADRMSSSRQGNQTVHFVFRRVMRQRNCAASARDQYALQGFLDEPHALLMTVWHENFGQWLHVARIRKHSGACPRRKYVAGSNPLFLFSHASLMDVKIRVNLRDRWHILCRTALGGGACERHDVKIHWLEWGWNCYGFASNALIAGSSTRLVKHFGLKTSWDL